MGFKESEHPRDADGKVTDGTSKREEKSLEEIAREIFPHLRESGKESEAEIKKEDIQKAAEKEEKDLNLSEEKIIIEQRREEFKKKLNSGEISTRISPQKQARHIKGSKQFEQYCKILSEKGDNKPSYIREDWTIEDLEKHIVPKLKGYVSVKSDGSCEEYVMLDEIVGYYYSPTKGEYIPTRTAKVKYSAGRNNIHIIPVKENPKEK